MHPQRVDLTFHERFFADSAHERVTHECRLAPAVTHALFRGNSEDRPAVLVELRLNGCVQALAQMILDVKARPLNPCFGFRGMCGLRQRRCSVNWLVPMAARWARTTHHRPRCGQGTQSLNAVHHSLVPPLVARSATYRTSSSSRFLLRECFLRTSPMYDRSSLKNVPSTSMHPCENPFVES